MNARPPAAVPDAKTPLGVLIWYVPGAEEVLGWQGDHDRVRRYRLHRTAGGDKLGAPIEAVSGHLEFEADACAAAGAWLARNVSTTGEDGRSRAGG